MHRAIFISFARALLLLPPICQLDKANQVSELYL